MWFRVYCESLLTELECHVLWWDSNRLDACSSLQSWMKKKKRKKNSVVNCLTQRLGPSWWSNRCNLTLLTLQFKVFKHVSIFVLPAEKMNHNSIRICQKTTHRSEWGKGKVSKNSEGVKLKGHSLFEQESSTWGGGHLVTGNFLSCINLGICSWGRLFLKSLFLQERNNRMYYIRRLITLNLLKSLQFLFLASLGGNFLLGGYTFLKEIFVKI